MKRFESIVSNAVFALLCLLTMLLVFEDSVRVPFWLQPMGRMHPLLLHFPVVLIFLLILLSFFKRQLDAVSYQKINRFLLLFASLTTTLTVVMGFLLYKEGYASELMLWHKWLGVALAYLLYLLTFIQTKKVLYHLVIYGSGVLTVLVGHFGAGITHGSNFLTEPLAEAQTPIITEDSPIFTAFVQPILKKKCISCHNSEKHKGDLNMSTLENILKGGENGPIWVAGDSEKSEVIKRVLLPLEHEEHMPPEGKTQLSDAELLLIRQWIDAGADTTVSISALSDSLPLYALVRDKWFKKPKQKQKYPFEYADPERIVSLNNPYRNVIQKSPKSSAIDVTIFGRQAFRPEFISELTAIKEQIVSLNLSHLPITDKILGSVAKLTNLEELNLNFTDITTQGLAQLSACNKLESLSLTGTVVDTELQKTLKLLPELKVVFLWSTNISDDEIAAFQKTFPNVQFVTGYKGDPEEELQLAAPLLNNKGSVLSKDDLIRLDHKLVGTIIRYTTDGSIPDSTSQQYSAPLKFTETFTLKAKAFKNGWESSNVAAFNFFREGLKPQHFELLSKPDQKHKGLGSNSLIDGYIGGRKRLITLAWTGFTEEPMITLADFGEKPPSLDKVVLSYALATWRRVLPPESIEVWGGDDKTQLKLLNKKTLRFTKETNVHGVSSASVKFSKSTFRYYKVIATQFQKTPKWLNKGGKKGELFVDEVFFY